MILKATASTSQLGSLYIVATPIGNLEDITFRAVRILRDEVACIACEDTRQTQKLLHHYEIRKPLLSYHEHNERSRTDQILEILERGDSVALVSDAGTPLVSDPGYRVARAAVERGFRVTPVPGPAAFLAALTGSGLPSEGFRFIGFLPARAGARRRTLEALAAEQSTVIAYETPHRILDALGEIAEILPARELVLARELTKIHEEFLRGTAAEIRAELAKRTSVKGEITLIIGPAPDHAAHGDPLGEVSDLEAAGLTRMDAIKSAAKKLGLPKREIYRLLMDRQGAPAQDSSPPDKRRG